MSTKNRKTRKLRGSKTHGWGSKKKHRGRGSRGGTGKAGWMSHKKSYMLKYFPDHFGRSGFKIRHERDRSINLRTIDILAKRLDTKEIDVGKLGYDKVLSNGKLTQALTIKAEKFVEKAKQKIIDSGGTPVETKKAE
jgi:large subunit ribosomal protein L15